MKFAVPTAVRLLLPIVALSTPLVATGLAASAVTAPAPALCSSAPVAAAYRATRDDLPPAFASALEVALERGFDADAHVELYRLAMLEWSDIGPLMAALDDLALDGTSDAALRARCGWLQAHLSWNDGELDDARRRLRDLAETVDDAAVWWSLGCVHDALDDRESAKDSYQRALDADPSAALEGQLRLRLAMLPIGLSDESDDAAAEALVEFGSRAARDEDERNRAAIVLSLDGRFAEALELFQVGDVAQQKSAETFRRQLRLTEWALAAEEPERAQQLAWDAVHSAGPRRDRRYALGLLVEAHRLDESLEALIERIQSDPERSDESTQVWIELLRETGRFEEAMDWFRASEEASAGADEDLVDEVRRQLLDLCREWGREDLLEQEYARLIAANPASIIWREGLSRFLLEKGRADEARAVWADYLTDPKLRRYLLTAAGSMAGLGLDDLALEACEVCIAAGREPLGAMLFASDMHRQRGRLDESLAQLERMHATAPADAPERLALAEAFERIGALERSVEVLEGVREALGVEGRAEDLDMRLAWLLSEVDREDDALALWTELWRRVDSPGRRRYVEERLMSVASRLGVLADIAIDLETKLAAGEADDRDAGLLVQLYSRVKDAVSATEVLEMFLASSGGSKRTELEEKSRIFLQCNDYYRYERTLRELIEVDPEGAPDYLRQLAMSALERGQAREAREILEELVRTERGTDSAEFEAGVLALAGLREEAASAYRRGIAANPDRIENFLLLANVMRDLGDRNRAVGMFQYLAERADQDDLFTIAIDGLLNMEAGERALRWARRCALERIASRDDKTYLYQLVADLSEQLDDEEFMVRALEGALPIAAERRVSLLRELLDLSTRRDRVLRFGRRLVGSGQLVPPDVYLQLGETFLKADDVVSAARTFAVADSLQEASTFQLDVARIFEQQLYLERAKDAYSRALIGRDADVGLLAKLGEIHEQVGDDASAWTYYSRAIDLLMSRQPLVATKSVAVGGSDNSFNFFSARNVDDYDQYLTRCRTGLLTAGRDREALRGLVRDQIALLHAELAATLEQADSADRDLAQFPRVARRADFARSLALSTGLAFEVEAFDLDLIRSFPGDEGLLARLVSARTNWGFQGAARRLWEQADVPAERREALAYQFAGGASGATLDTSEGFDARVAVRRIPRLVADGASEDLRALLLAILSDPNASEALDPGALFSAACEIDDTEVRFRVLRLWIDRSLARTDSYEVRRALALAAKALPEDYRALLEDHVTRSVLGDDARAAGMLDLVLELEDSSGRDLVTDEQLVDLVDRAFESRGYWAVYPFFRVLPDEAFAGVLRRTLVKVPESSRADFLLDLVGGMDRPLAAGAAELVRGAFRDAVAKVDNPQWLTYTLQQLGQSKHDPALALDLIDEFCARWGDGPQYLGTRIGALCTLGRRDDALALMFSLYEDGVQVDDDDWELRQAIQTAEAALLPDSLDALVERQIEIGESTGDLADARSRCLVLYRRAFQQDGTLRFHRWAAERWPDDVDVLGELAAALRRDEPARWERLAVLERIAELAEPGSEAAEDALKGVARFWKDLENPVEEERWDELAKAARKERRAREKAERAARKAAEEAAEKEAEQEADDVDPEEGSAVATIGTPVGGSVSAAASLTTVPPVSSGSPSSGSPSSGSTATGSSAPSSTSSSSVPAVAMTPAAPLGGSSTATIAVSSGGGSFVVMDDGTFFELEEEADDERGEKAPRANLATMAGELAADAPDLELARAVFRRMWRSFPADDDMFFFFGGNAGFGGWNGVPERWSGEVPLDVLDVIDPEAATERRAALEAEAAALAAAEAEAALEAEAEGDDGAADDGAAEDTADADSVDVLDAAAEELASEDDEGIEADETPSDADAAPAATAERKKRGGLDDLRDPPAQTVAKTYGTYEVLVEIAEGRAEMERQLRTRTPEQLDFCGPIFEAIAARDRRILSADGALDALIERFDAERAGRIELELLLQHLLAGHGTEREDVRAVLDQLLANTGPTDSARLVELARLLASGGRTEWAERLLPWCASLASLSGGSDPFGGAFVVFDANGQSSVTPAGLQSLIKAVRESLEGEARVAAIDSVLERMRPIDLKSAYDPYAYYDPWSSSDAGYVNVVLRTWLEELPPTEAVERCRETIDSLLAWDGKEQPNRSAALVACEMCAKAGDVERAARLLEIALVEHEFDPTVDAMFGVVYFDESGSVRTTGSLSLQDQHRLFPEPGSDAASAFADPSAWYAAASNALRDLLLRGEMEIDLGLRTLGLALWRLTGSAHVDAVDGAVAGLERFASTHPESLLWVLDGAVRSGRERAVLPLEAAYAEARLLRSDRVSDAVWRAWDLEGEAAGLALAEDFGTWTLPKSLLDQLVTLCVATGDEARAAYWRGVRDEAY
ncbi:hypothetical protein Pla163_09340 [Planctomycetes bacterium Pla163]|uniref:Tetratricopeptide repeat protein n=1 Tax=Rohdeia mirabilis TaxID=2528008 RepID=A0A518CX80_9BACT|nr:hypothetical protein Pla163_09340 [Planctomycetes bacterium Pla163]